MASKAVLTVVTAKDEGAMRATKVWLDTSFRVQHTLPPRRNPFMPPMVKSGLGAERPRNRNCYMLAFKVSRADCCDLQVVRNLRVERVTSSLLC